MKIAAVIVAAGRGSRAIADGMLAATAPKQYVRIGGKPVLQHTLEAFISAGEISTVQVVIHHDDEGLYRQSVGTDVKLRTPVPGGATRQASVLAGLEAVRDVNPDVVLIHDAARPFVSQATIADVVSALKHASGAIAAVPLADTLKRSDSDGRIAATVDRAGLWRAQTPQGFRFEEILKAHRAAAAAGRWDFTDDAAIAEWAGLDVVLVADSSNNSKLTTVDDIAAAHRRMKTDMDQSFEFRTGQGFDVHRFCDGDHVWLGGVKIPHTHKLEGHSDADVVLHALTDALLGTIGDGDIGQHFPPSDPKWKGAASHLFLADAERRIRARGGGIVNVDVTILAEAPKVGPHREAMQKVIAKTLAISPDRVGIKATTTEQMGFTGRREGIAATAIATVKFPLHTP